MASPITLGNPVLAVNRLGAAQIREYDTAGALVQTVVSYTIGTPDFVTLEDLAFAPDGTLYALDVGSGTFVKVAPDGTVTRTSEFYSGLPPSAALQSDFPQSLAFGTDGRMFVGSDAISPLDVMSFTEFDPADGSYISETNIPPAASYPGWDDSYGPKVVGITIGPGGELYFNDGDSGQTSGALRIDPGTGEYIAGEIWQLVAKYDGGVLTHLGPDLFDVASGLQNFGGPFRMALRSNGQFICGTRYDPQLTYANGEGFGSGNWVYQLDTDGSILNTHKEAVAYSNFCHNIILDGATAWLGYGQGDPSSPTSQTGRVVQLNLDTGVFTELFSMGYVYAALAVRVAASFRRRVWGQVIG